MKHGVITQALVPGRREPGDKFEMVTQLIFGERYKVLESSEKWVLIENEADNYQCWIDVKQHHGISESSFLELCSLPQKRCGDSIGYLTDAKGHRFPIPCSALLAGYHDGHLAVDGEAYNFDGRIARHDADSVQRHARRLLHTPYLWGGKSALGMDCSGFVQVVFACAGKMLPRDAYQQAELGESVDFIDLTKAGDLLFFENAEGRIHHVGIALGGGLVIHASGSVRIDQADHEGIFNEKLKKYTHKLRLIKRL